MAASVKIAQPRTNISAEESVIFHAPEIAEIAKEGRIALAGRNPSGVPAKDRGAVKRACVFMEKLIEEVERYMTRNEPLPLDQENAENSLDHMTDMEPKRAFLAEIIGIPSDLGYLRGTVVDRPDVERIVKAYNRDRTLLNRAAFFSAIDEMKALIGKPFHEYEPGDASRLYDFFLRVETLAKGEGTARKRELHAP